MTTNAHTISKPRNFAVTPNTQKILAFDDKGMIDVFLFDDTTAIITMLGLDKSLHIPLSDLANANILFCLSQQLGLLPGETIEQDQQILDHLRLCLSLNIKNKDVVVKEIINSWNKIAQLPISTMYAKIKSEQTDTVLDYQGAYELSLHSYITSYLSTLSQYEKVQTWAFIQAGELMYSTLEGKAFSTNPYLKMLSLAMLAEKCVQDVKDSSENINNIKRRLEKEQAKWFVDIIGLVGFEVEAALGDKEAMETASELQSTLEGLLHGDNTLLSKDKLLNDIFEQTFALARNPLENILVKKADPAPTEEQVRQAIAYVIEKNLREKQIKLVSNDSSNEINLLQLASSKLQHHHETLIEMLLAENRYFTPRILNAIRKNTQNESIRDITQALLIKDQKKEKEEKQTQEKPLKRELTFQFDESIKLKKQKELEKAKSTIENDEESITKLDAEVIEIGNAQFKSQAKI